MVGSKCLKTRYDKFLSDGSASRQRYTGKKSDRFQSDIFRLLHAKCYNIDIPALVRIYIDQYHGIWLPRDNSALRTSLFTFFYIMTSTDDITLSR